MYHFILTKVPRPILIKASYIFNKIAPLLYSGNKFEDPIDGKTYRKLLPYGALKMRPNALAPASLSLERHRLLWLFLKEKTDFFSDREQKVLHVAPEQCFLNRFRERKNLDYITGDIVSPIADVKMDLHSIPFGDNTFDVVLCNHVLEHVDNHKRCMREIYRVLKPGGWAVMQVPMDYNREETYEDPTIVTEEERLKHYWQKDHVRLFGMDYPDLLKDAGFTVEEVNMQKELPEGMAERYALPEREPIYWCKKD